MKDRRHRKILATRRVSLHWLHCATTDEVPPRVGLVPASDADKPESVSVFGIFRNGRMSPEAWEEFGKTLSMPFSQGICQAAYDVVFTGANPELAATGDDNTRENAVSDELLAKFEPHWLVDANFAFEAAVSAGCESPRRQALMSALIGASCNRCFARNRIRAGQAHERPYSEPHWLGVSQLDLSR